MLVLTRRVNEKLVLHMDNGLKVELVVLGSHGRQVRLGVKAPQELHVDREEVYLRKQQGVSAA